MAVLVDTNILLSLQTHHPHFALVEQAFSVLRNRDEVLCLAVQNLIEFWAVATRPASENGLGMTTETATRELAVLKDLFALLPEPDSVFDEWERLVITHHVSGKGTHDARLVAVMKLSKVDRILTFNVADFARYEDVQALHPESFQLMS
jgi:predicted nucleic acid-binding protein